MPGTKKAGLVLIHLSAGSDILLLAGAGAGSEDREDKDYLEVVNCARALVAETEKSQAIGCTK